MFDYDNGIIDNYRVLREVRDMIEPSGYDRLLCVWGSENWKDYEEIALAYRSGEPEDITHEFAEALFELRQHKSSLISDGLFGIYVGLVPLKEFPDDCILPTYFIFRCRNNGRTLVISQRQLQ